MAEYGFRWRAEWLAKHPTPLEVERMLYPRTVVTPALTLAARRIRNTLNTADGRLILSIAPQEGKTRLLRSAGVWRLVTDPDSRLVYASYGIDLARRHGYWIREAINNHPLGIRTQFGHRSVTDWGIENHEGGVLSAGIESGLTGNPADAAIIDDPIKGVKQADSKVYREALWDWYTEVLVARLSPGAPVVLVSTRWHEDDLAGRLIREQPGMWDVLNIPAQCEDPATDPLGRKMGEYLESARRRTTAQWEVRKATVGARAWQAQYQGHPAPAKGGVFDRSHWKRWTEMPSLRGALMIQSWDLTFAGTEDSDYVVGQVWLKQGTDAFLIDQVRGQWDIVQTLQQIEAVSARWPQAVGKYVENKANGAAVIRLLQSKVPGLVPVNPTSSKEVRASSVQPLAQGGNVWLPADHMFDWAGGLVEELQAFPRGTHDDQVDALTQALGVLFQTAQSFEQSHIG